MGLLNPKKNFAEQPPQAPQTDASPAAVEYQSNQDEYASQEEQAELERAMDAVGELLLRNDQSNAAAMKIIKQSLEEPLAGVVSATKMVVLEVDRQLDVNEVVIPEMVIQTADLVMELGTEAGLLNLSDQEQADGLTLAAMGVLSEYDMDPEEVRRELESMSSEQMGQMNSAADMLGGP